MIQEKGEVMKGRYLTRSGLFFLLPTVLLISLAKANSKLSEGIVAYKPVKETSSIYGTLRCKGSTNVAKLLNIWVPKFKKLYPNVKSSMEFKGSGDGIHALMLDKVNIAASSRPIQEKELQTFKEKKGYVPIEIKVSLDALAIYVNRLNHLEYITLEELDAVFSTSRNRQYQTDELNSWFKLTGINKKINIYLFDSYSGTRSYFKNLVLKKGDFKSSNIISEEFTKSEEVIAQVASDPYGITFASAGSKNYKVKTLALSKHSHFPSYKPSYKNIKNESYPLTRYFYLYLDIPKHKPIPKLLYEFFKFILSRNGQECILNNSGIPLSPKQIGIELSKIRRD
jgi:phosphate transport system substrate-binding protein